MLRCNLRAIPFHCTIQRTQESKPSPLWPSASDAGCAMHKSTATQAMLHSTNDRGGFRHLKSSHLLMQKVWAFASCDC